MIKDYKNVSYVDLKAMLVDLENERDQMRPKTDECIEIRGPIHDIIYEIRKEINNRLGLKYLF